MKTRYLSYTLFAASLLMVSCNAKEEATPAQTNKEAVVSVVVDTLKATAFDEWVSYPAELRGIQDVQLTAGGGGRLMQIAEVGTWVKEGDALCDIETARYSATLEQAKAAVELAQGELSRAEANVKAGSVGKASLDKAKLDFEGARVGLLQATRAYEDSRCQAPFNGVVVARSVDKFATLPPGSPTVRLARTDKLEALISLAESDLSSYAKGSKVRFLVPGNGDVEYPGSLRSVDLAVDSHTRTALARLEIINRKHTLGPGMAGKALLLRNSYKAALVIPSTAILRNENGPFAMVAENNVARKHELTLGPADGDSVVVLKGLKEGDLLITVGSFRASEGTKLKY